MVGPARCVPGDPLKGLGAQGARRRALGALLARLSPPSLWWPQVDVKHVQPPTGAPPQDDGERADGSHAVADKRVYCHEALHLKGKLQTAGYKQAVEKWDTDSDSDSSDEEDLKM